MQLPQPCIIADGPEVDILPDESSMPHFTLLAGKVGQWQPDKMPPLAGVLDLR